MLLKMELNNRETVKEYQFLNLAVIIIYAATSFNGVRSAIALPRTLKVSNTHTHLI